MAGKLDKEGIMIKILFEKVKKLLLSPHEEWRAIAAEELSIQDMFIKYAAYLALIPAVSMIIGFGIVGLRLGPTYYRMPIMSALFSGILSYILSLAGVLAGGYIINFLSQYFSAEGGIKPAMKLAVYSSTAYWISGIFGIIPSLGFLSILGLYSVYLLFVGIPILLKVPEDKTMPFIIAVVISSLVLGILLNAVVGQFVYGPIYSDLLTY